MREGSPALDDSLKWQVAYWAGGHTAFKVLSGTCTLSDQPNLCIRGMIDMSTQVYSSFRLLLLVACCELCISGIFDTSMSAI